MDRDYDWRERVHLFCNGMFYARSVDGVEGVIQGLLNAKNKLYKTKLILVDNNGKVHSVSLKGCVLFARLRSNMTPEEINNDPSGMVFNLIGKTSESFMYLIDNGILPPQFSNQYRKGGIDDVKFLHSKN